MSWQFLKDKTLVSKSHGIGDINPVYVGIERSFPDDSKNVSFVGMGLECIILTIPQINFYVMQIRKLPFEHCTMSNLSVTTRFCNLKLDINLSDRKTDRER